MKAANMSAAEKYAYRLDEAGEYEARFRFYQRILFQ